MRARARCLRSALLSLFLAFCLNAETPLDVKLAGFAFAGGHGDIQKRYPYTRLISEELKPKEEDKAGGLSYLLTQRAKGISNPAINLMPAHKLIDLRQEDQAMSVLVLTGETVLTEKYDTYTKTYIRLRGDAMIFDYKNKQIIVNYPIAVELFDAKEGLKPPSEEEIVNHIKNMIYDNGTDSLYSQYIKRLSDAVIPKPGTRTLQVSQVVIAPEAMGMFPEKLRSGATLQDMLSDEFTSVLSARANVSILPAKTGAVDAVMYLQLENRNDPIEIKPGSGDYLFDISLLKHVKKEHKRTRVEVGNIYAVKVHLSFYEPLSGERYFDADLQNAEGKVSLLKQQSGDDFPAFSDTLRRLFVKFADAAKSGDTSWIKTAASGPDVAAQLQKTHKTINFTR
jgi:hypothetical protein